MKNNNNRITPSVRVAAVAASLAKGWERYRASLDIRQISGIENWEEGCLEVRFYTGAMAHFLHVYTSVAADIEMLVSATCGILLLNVSEEWAQELYGRGSEAVAVWYGAMRSPAYEDYVRKAVMVFKLKDAFAEFVAVSRPSLGGEMAFAALLEVRTALGFDRADAAASVVLEP